MKRNFLLIIGVLCSFLSCNTENKRYEDFFMKNFTSLDSMRTYVEDVIKTKKKWQ